MAVRNTRDVRKNKSIADTMTMGSDYLCLYQGWCKTVKSRTLSFSPPHWNCFASAGLEYSYALELCRFISVADISRDVQYVGNV